MIGIMRAGYTVFPISARNSPAAVAHLLKETNVTHLFVGQNGNLQSIIDAAYGMLEGQKPVALDMPTFTELYSVDDERAVEANYYSPSKLDATVLIMHSSGSTSFPKPIPMTHYHLLHLSMYPCTPYKLEICSKSLTKLCFRVRRC